MGSPCSDNSIVGTVDNGARSESVDCVRARPARRVYGALGGEDEGIKVEEVGTGVG